MHAGVAKWLKPWTQCSLVARQHSTPVLTVTGKGVGNALHARMTPLRLLRRSISSCRIVRLNRCMRRATSPCSAANRANVSYHACRHACTPGQLYAFSNENWRRGEAEVAFLMRLFEGTLQQDADEMCRRGIRLLVVGARERLPASLRERIERWAAGLGVLKGA